MCCDYTNTIQTLFKAQKEKRYSSIRYFLQLQCFSSALVPPAKEQNSGMVMNINEAYTYPQEFKCDLTTSAPPIYESIH